MSRDQQQKSKKNVSEEKWSAHPSWRAVFCWLFLEERQPSSGTNGMSYSSCLSSGRSANSSASLAILRGCLGLRAMRVSGLKPVPSKQRYLVPPTRHEKQERAGSKVLSIMSTRFPIFGHLLSFGDFCRRDKEDLVKLGLRKYISMMLQCCSRTGIIGSSGEIGRNNTSNNRKT